MDSFNGKNALSMEVFQIILDPQWKNHRNGKILKIPKWRKWENQWENPSGEILQGTKVLLVQSSSNFVLQSLVQPCRRRGSGDLWIKNVVIFEWWFFMGHGAFMGFYMLVYGDF